MDIYEELKKCKPGSTRIDEQGRVWRICLPSNEINCEKEKLIENFVTKNDGRSFNKTYNCKECDNIRNRQHSKNNFIQTWAKDTICHHKNKGYKINFKNIKLRGYAVHIDYCEYCGVQLNWSRDGDKEGKPQSNSPTLENIFRKEILNLSDIAIICHRCNSARGDMPIPEWLEHCRRVINNAEKILERTKEPLFILDASLQE